MSATNKTHPMIILAAGAVVLLSFAGVASLMGWLPPAGSASQPAPALVGTAPVQPAPSGAQEASNPAPTIAAATPAPAISAPKPVVKPAPVKSAPLPTSSPPIRSEPPTPTYVSSAPLTSVPKTKPACNDCGVVDNINTIQKQAEGSGAGAIIGGIVGGVLGHQVGGGRGKDVATVAGAVGGAYAGNEIEKSNKKSVSFEVRVRMEDGTYRTLRFATQPAVRVGDNVRIENGRLIRERG